MDSTTIHWSRDIRVRYETDVAVIGGGITGVSAACATAKTGAEVILVERFAVTGGMLTIGGVANFCGETAGQGEIFDEIVANLEQFDAIVPYKPYSERETRVLDHEILAVVLQEMLLKYGVKLLLHTRFVDVVRSHRTLSECIICGQSGPEALRATQFIDCTGEGQVAHMAGFATMKGRKEDGLQLPMSMMYFLRELPESVNPQVPEQYFHTFHEIDELPMHTLWPNGPQSKTMKIKVPKFDSTDTESMTEAEIHSRRRMLEVLDFFQRYPKTDWKSNHFYGKNGSEPEIDSAKWRFDHASPIIGIREGRRIVGDYILTLEDLRAGREFDDAIARGVFYLDGHKPDDERRTYILPKNQLYVPPYQIPLRCLIAKDGENLLMAGRCMSAEQLALSSARVTTTCSMMGQAAGILAALAVKKHTSVRNIDPLEIRKILEEKGAKLDVNT